MTHASFAGGVRNDPGSTASKISIRPDSVDLGMAGEMIRKARGVFTADPPGGVMEIIGTAPLRRP
jgi:hypothetical protein